MSYDQKDVVFEPVFEPAFPHARIVKEKDAEIQRLRRELTNIRQTLTDALALNQDLNRENSILRQRNTRLEHAKNASEDKLQHLVAGIGKMRPGVGGRGVNRVKNMAAAVQAGIII